MPDLTTRGFAASNRRRSLLVLAGVLASGLVPATALAATPGNVHSAVAVSPEAWAAGRAAHGPNATAAQAVAAYWTPQRMRLAKRIEDAPFVKPERESTGPVASAASAGKTRTSRATKRRPFSVAPARGKLSLRAGARARAAAYNPNLSYNTPTAYTNGKVFFNMGGSSWVCSGAIVNSPGADSVWTAGHCVYPGGSGRAWATNWVFVPAYDDDLANPRPYGTWTAAGLSTTNGWYNSSYAGEDIGVATMNTNFGGWHIVNYFGGHGFRANQGKYVRENAFGYPSQAPFDGGNLMGCEGTTQPEWDYGTISSDILRLPCDMTPGASGGPWLIYYNGNWGYLNGVNSLVDKVRSVSKSPYFGDAAQGLYNYTKDM